MYRHILGLVFHKLPCDRPHTEPTAEDFLLEVARLVVVFIPERNSLLFADEVCTRLTLETFEVVEFSLKLRPFAFDELAAVLTSVSLSALKATFTDRLSFVSVILGLEEFLTLEANKVVRMVHTFEGFYCCADHETFARVTLLEDVRLMTGVTVQLVCHRIFVDLQLLQRFFAVVADELLQMVVVRLDLPPGFVALDLLLASLTHVTHLGLTLG